MSDETTGDAPWEADNPTTEAVETSTIEVIDAPEATADGAHQTEPLLSEESPAEAVSEGDTPAKKTRNTQRPRGWLETDVKFITDKFVTGEITLGDGEHMTPHRVAKLVQVNDSLDAPPSSGAVAAVFKRWSDLGFAQIGTKPVAFIDYTDEGRSEGLTALKEARNASVKKMKQAAKEAAKAEAAETATAPAAAPAAPDAPADESPAPATEIAATG